MVQITPGMCAGHSMLCPYEGEGASALSIQVLRLRVPGIRRRMRDEREEKSGALSAQNNERSG
jgi:hypothetical protein